MELVSANENYKVEVIWETALKFRDTVGIDYLIERRQQQAKRAMWKYLGQAVMEKLKEDDSKYGPVIASAEQSMLSG